MRTLARSLPSSSDTLAPLTSFFRRLIAMGAHFTRIWLLVLVS